MRVSCLKYRLCLIGTLSVCAWIGCSPGRQAAVQLDRVARSIDRYGFAGISAPFLTTPQPSFKFDLNKSADYFYERALTSVQGGVRQFSATAVDTQIAVRMNVEQALATVAQLDRARTIAEFRDAQRKASIQKSMLLAAVSAASPPPELAAAVGAASPQVGTLMALTNPSDNPLVKATLGMLDVAISAPEPDPEALPGFTPSNEAPPTRSPIDLSDRLALAAVGNNFTPGLSFPDGTFQITAREAMLQASGDSLTQALLGWFQYPQGNRLGDYELFFCPVIVSVKPGYETRNNYQADITVSVDLARKSGDGLEFLSSKFPDASPPIQVAGVFPVIDTQVLDLVSSRRKLYSLAFQLSMVGFGSQANVFSDYADKLESDAKTRSSLTVASAYTIGSTAFGFRVEPQSVALENPTALDSKPGSILQSKTFPAMAMLLVHRSYLRDRRQEVKALVEDGKPIPEGHWKRQQNAGGTPASIIEHYRANDAADADQSKYDFLVLRTSVRWSPVAGSLLGLHDRQSEVELWERAEALDSAAHWVDSAKARENQFGDSLAATHRDANKNGFQRAHLASRVLTLRQMALDTQALIRIDHRRPSDEVTVSSYEPKNGWLDQPTYVTIYGSGFEGNVETVTVGGRPCAFYIASDECMVVTVPAWQERDVVAEQPEDLKRDADVAPGDQKLMGASDRLRMALASLGSRNPGDPALSKFWNSDDADQVKPDNDAASKPGDGDKPQQTRTPTFVGDIVIGSSGRVFKAYGCTCDDCKCNDGKIGEITFDRIVPVPLKPAGNSGGGGGGGDKNPSVSIGRGNDGKITGVATKGDFNQSLELLKQIAPALHLIGAGAVEVNVSGGIRAQASSCLPADGDAAVNSGAKAGTAGANAGAKADEPGGAATNR